MSHYPKDWARRGNGTTRDPKDPAKSMSLDFRTYIEGRSYSRKVRYAPVDTRPEYGECVGVAVHTIGFPSGGSVDYTGHAYFDGVKWEFDRNWDYYGHDTIESDHVTWYRVVEAPELRQHRAYTQYLRYDTDEHAQQAAEICEDFMLAYVEPAFDMSGKRSGSMLVLEMDRSGSTSLLIKLEHVPGHMGHAWNVHKREES